MNSPTQIQSTANDAGWKKALADAIERDQRGKAGVADVLGVSRGYVSQIVNGHRDVVPDAFVVRVLERLCAIQCPHLGQSIAHSVCRQHAGRKWEAISQFEVDHWRACQSCTNKAPDPLPTPLKPRPDEWVFVPRPSRHVTQGAPL